MLARLAEIGMDMAEMVNQQAKDARWVGSDGILMLERLGRMVRRTMALETRLEADARVPNPLRAAAPQHAKTMAPEAGQADQAAVDADADARADARDANPRHAEDLVADLRERFEDPDDELGGQPVGVVLTAIHRDLRAVCDDLGVTDRATSRAEQSPEQDGGAGGARSEPPGDPASWPTPVEARRGSSAFAEDDGGGPVDGGGGPPAWPPRDATGCDPP